MKAWPFMPGVPAAGHITSSGHWHPRGVNGCSKCQPPPTLRYVLCERNSATPTSAVHIRALAPGEEPRLGGGVNAVTLCGAHLRGWDLPGEVKDRHVSATALEAECGPTCRRCAVHWRRR